METKFIFVNIQKPSDALQLSKESQVRSHVTRHQWKQARRDKRPQNKLQKLQLVNLLHNVNGAECRTGFEFNVCRLGTGYISPQIGGLRVDPFQSYPISVQPWTPLLVDHYLTHMAVDIPELDLPGKHGLLRTLWFPLVMTEPALFSVIILLAASHYASLQRDIGSMKMDLLGLRYEAVQSINRCLDAQPPHTINDALIGAIAKMASYEAMFGSLKNYDIHMQGLVRAINLRGGLGSLGLDGLLHRIVVWIDCNAAFLQGSAKYYLVDTSVLGEPPDPNPGQFLGSS